MRTSSAVTTPLTAVICAAALLFHVSSAFLETNPALLRIPLHHRSEQSVTMGTSKPSAGVHNNDWQRRKRRRCRHRCNALSTAATNDDNKGDPTSSPIIITSEDVRTRNLKQLEKLRIRDRQSLKLSGSDLVIVYEDDHLVCVNKPPGVLCVPSEENIPTLAQTVFESVSHQQTSLDRMVVHRLGMDTSGLVVFAKNMESLRAMNTLFRTRKITRKYEALLCGHLREESGAIDLPLMRDYARPPYMRISTDEHQRAINQLKASVVGKKLLEAPKASKTLYRVLSRETLEGLDVTRVELTSVTGRTHQLNVHTAAIGHPIVGDRVYGCRGAALPHGGLERPVFANPAPEELQDQIAAVATTMCVHAKSLEFQHPMRSTTEAEAGDPLLFECPTPF